MTNPNNAVGTNGAFGGRTSVNAINDILGAFSMGIISGWECAPDSGLTITLGGNGSVRDVALAEDNAGNKTTINNISGSPISVTIPAAPASNSRIDLIIAYVDNPPTGVSTVIDNPSACGLIVVSGSPSVSPVEPNESAIRTAITSDGASGANAYYVILAKITIASGTTTITGANISQLTTSVLSTAQIGDGSIDSTKLDMTTLGGDYSTTEIDTGFTWIDGSHIYKKTIDTGTLPNATTKSVAYNISNLSRIIKFEGYAYNSGSDITCPLPFVSSANIGNGIQINISATDIVLQTGSDRSGFTESYITLYYTKTA